MDINKMSISDLVTYLNRFRESYYNGSPEISDEQFDFVERRLRELDPINDYFNQVGRSTLTRDIPIEHKIPMLSMQKVQNVSDGEKWYKDVYNRRYLINISENPILWVDPKLDGVSGKVVYGADGEFVYAATRGDGTVGAKITYGDRMNSIPKKFLPNTELRGEFIIPKKHQKHFDGPLRNNCSGILKRKDYSEELDYIQFVIYNFYSYDKESSIEFNNRGELLKTVENELLSLGYKYNKDYFIVRPFKTSNIGEVYGKYITSLRDSWAWETDGIVLTIDGPRSNYDLVDSDYKISSFNRYNMAIKPPALFAESIVTDIIAYTNRTKVSFVAVIEPVQLMDIVCTRATLDNYSLMTENKIGIGSKVLIKRSNDVIPKIVEVYNPKGSKTVYPDFSKCPSCGHKLVRINRDLACTNEYGCLGILTSKLLNMFKSTKTKNIGPALAENIAIEMLFRKETTWYDFLSTCLDDGYGDAIGLLKDSKSRSNFDESIRFMLYNMTELQFLDGIGIPSIGSTQFLNNDIKTIDEFLNYYEKLKSSDRIALSAIDSVIYKWCSDDKHLQDIKQCNVLMRDIFIVGEIVNGDKLTYCISGEIKPYPSKKDIVQLLGLNNNLIYSETLTSKTNYLITDSYDTSKAVKAKKYNIPIVSVDYLMKLC